LRISKVQYRANIAGVSPIIANIFLRQVNVLKKISTLVPVVAAALVDAQGRVLMQKRRAGAVHGGLWEFPGGKVQPGETLEEALAREIAEELDLVLDPEDLAPCGFACEEPLLLLLFVCRSWRGEPRCLAGEAIGWFTPAELALLAMPPLDVPLAQALGRAI
jgi:8-oxo-dGTP diphosphatase